MHCCCLNGYVFLGRRERGIQKQERDMEEQKTLMDKALENKINKGFSLFYNSKSYHSIKNQC